MSRGIVLITCCGPHPPTWPSPEPRVVGDGSPQESLSVLPTLPAEWLCAPHGWAPGNPFDSQLSMLVCEQRAGVRGQPGGPLCQVEVPCWCCWAERGRLLVLPLSSCSMLKAPARSLLFPLVAASTGSSELFRSRSPQGPEFEECGPSWVHTHSASMLGSAPGFRSGRGCRTEKGPEKGLGKGLARPWRAPHWRGYLN